MKLLSCHIENFGVLHDRDFTFDAGLNVFFRPNGTGKSTLSAFIRAMLYGMDTSRSNAQSLPDRSHYCPFGGGSYGGSLTYEQDGREYRVERFFDEKSAARDSVTFYCGTEPIPLPEGGIGEALFGLNEDSFGRTVSITADTVETGVGSDISSRLGSVLDDSDADLAAEKLDRSIRELRPKRGPGLIAEKKAGIRTVRGEIEALETIRPALDEKYLRRDALERQITETDARLRAENEKKLLLGKWEHYDRLRADEEQRADEAAQLSARYPGGLPDKDELDRLSETATALAGAAALAAASLTRPEDEARLAALEGKFLAPVPDGDGFDALAALCADASAAAQRAAALAPDDGERARLSLLRATRFPAGLPTAAELESADAALTAMDRLAGTIGELETGIAAEKNERYKTLKRRYAGGADEDRAALIREALEEYRKATARAEVAHEALDAAQAKRAREAERLGRRRDRIRHALLLPGALCAAALLAGLVLLFFAPGAGAILAGIGGAGLCACLLAIFWVGLRRVPPADTTRAEQDIRDAETDAANALGSVQAFLDSYGIPGDDPEAGLDEYEDGLRALRDADARIGADEEKLAACRRDADALENAVTAFAARCGYADLAAAPRDALLRLRSDSEEMTRLIAREADLASRRQTETAAADGLNADLRGRLAAFLREVPEKTDAAFLSALRADAADLEALRRARAHAEETRKKAENAAADARRAAGELLGKYTIPLPDGGLDKLCDTLIRDREALRAAEAARAKARTDAADYLAANGLGERPDNPAGDTDALEASLSALRTGLASLAHEISDDEYQLSALPEKEALRAALEEDLDALTSRLDLLEKTRALLCRADEALRNRYVAPVREEFLRWAGRIEAAIGERMVMDTEYRVLFERGGVLRTDRFLSAGQRDICSLCLRLALLANIYPDEKPFLILDDPFVKLDAPHMERTAEVLRTVAEDYQILYFCCHESRIIPTTIPEDNET